VHERRAVKVAAAYITRTAVTIIVVVLERPNMDASLLFNKHVYSKEQST